MQNRQADPPRAKFYRERDLLAMLPFSRATLWARVRDGRFPAPVKLSTRVTVWSADAVDAFLERLASGASAQSSAIKNAPSAA